MYVAYRSLLATSRQTLPTQHSTCPLGSTEGPRILPKAALQPGTTDQTQPDEEKAFLPFLRQTLALSLIDDIGPRLEDTKLLKEMCNK